MSESSKNPAKRGRPSTHKLPPPIPETPEHIAEVVLQAKPKKIWWFEEDAKNRQIRRLV